MLQIGEIGFFKDLAAVAASIGKDGIPYGQVVKGIYHGPITM